MADGAGGVIVAWLDDRATSLTFHVYAQRLSSAGNALWTANGIAVNTAAHSPALADLIADGAGGTIIVWTDTRQTALRGFAQRIGTNGNVMWAINGVQVATATGSQHFIQTASDRAGGVIVAWVDNHNTTFTDIYAQRLSPAGGQLWSATGSLICDLGNSQSVPDLAVDASGNPIIVWEDKRGPTYDLFAQRLMNSSGFPTWTPNGVKVCGAAGDQRVSRVIAHDSGDATFVWRDSRVGNYIRVYSQRVEGINGDPLWATNGVVMCAAAGNVWDPHIVGDEMASFVTWYDARTGNDDIYLQRMQMIGTWGHPEPFAVSATDRSQDQGGFVVLDWLASDRDGPVNTDATHYSVWRAADVAGANTAMESAERLESRAQVGVDFAGPAVYVEHAASGPLYWEFVGTIPATTSATYQFDAPTRQDAIPGFDALHHFEVLAHPSDPFLFWESNMVDGYSIDNLAPAAPFALTAQRDQSDVILDWSASGHNEPDFDSYAVYRAAQSGVPTTPGTEIATVSGTTWSDIDAPTTALYYVVTALDVHGNQSAPSNEVFVDATTSVGVPQIPSALRVLPNAPNPFVTSTTFAVGLPTSSGIRVELFDVTGRRVAGRDAPAMAAGWHSIRIDDRDANGRLLPSGVYFCRIMAGTRTVTQKVMIQR
jgi:hypothetical protein